MAAETTFDVETVVVNYNSHEYTDPKLYTGRDVLGRELKHRYDDRCIDPVSGKLIPLEVQCTNDVLAGSGGSTWRRRNVENIGPYFTQLTTWASASLRKYENSSLCSLPVSAVAEYLGKTLLILLPITFLALFSNIEKGKFVNGGRYSAVPYRYYGRAKKSRNPRDDAVAETENERHAQFHALQADPAPAVQNPGDVLRVERTLLPRRLCFLDQPPTRVLTDNGEECLSYDSMDVQQWMRNNQQDCPEYLFVAWSGEQFSNCPKDHQKLHELARYATKKAGLEHYWISLNCMGDRAQLVVDVWRISDVIRGCKKFAIVLKTPENGETLTGLLTNWVKSIWTFPELLLSPGSDVRTYHYSALDSSNIVEEIHPKNQFAARYIETNEDRYQVRRLFDHYLGSLKLSDLELTSVALHCFSLRKSASEFLPGDYTYALMGLLGHRPRISPSDSAFMAFARLSLENYNSRLFERLICILPAEPDQPWHKLRDAYGAQLWDIEPSVQVAGIGVYDENVQDPTEGVFENEYFLNAPIPEGHGIEPTMDENDHRSITSEETHFSAQNAHPSHTHGMLRDDDVVILDGCYAAKVHWKSFQPVLYSRNVSITRSLLKWMIRLNPLLLIAGIAVLGATGRSPGGLIVGFVLLLFGLPGYFTTPVMARKVAGGKVWESQPWFFGFEGYLPIEEIEHKIFGDSMGRLMWTPCASSPLLYHIMEDNRWIVPQDPSKNQATARLINAARHAQPGDWRVFTLVDTYSMTVTLFEAKRPPQALLICGSEGGMQRALACSFEWTTSTFYKETVLRLETRTIERMDRIRKVRFGIQRMQRPTQRTSRRTTNAARI